MKKTCPECRREISNLKDGRLRAHLRPGGAPCAGMTAQERRLSLIADLRSRAQTTGEYARPQMTLNVIAEGIAELLEYLS